MTDVSDETSNKTGNGKSGIRRSWAPIAAVKAISARLGDMRDAINSSRKDMSDDLIGEMNQWITEGEQVIERAMERIRSTGAPREIRDRTGKAAEATESGVRKMTKAIDEGMNLITPDAELERINGIGPSYAKQLRSAGVKSVADFISLTGTTEDLSKLAEKTGFAMGTVEAWRDQIDLARIDGIGGAYQRLLHRADVWTIRELGQSDPEWLTDELNSIDTPDAPDQMPSIYQVKQWVTAGGKIARSG